MRLAALALATTLVACPLAAQAQPKVAQVAYLGFLGEPAEGSPLRDAFMLGLREHGYAAGRNIEVHVRRYTSDAELRTALKDVIGRKVDVIFVGPPLAAMTAKQMTREIAIVCGSCGDPVENGLAATLGRPGANVTGLASLSAELIGKRIGLLKELLPDSSRLAVFVFPANPGTPATLKSLEAIGKNLGIELRRFEIRGRGDFDAAFRSAASAGARAVVLQDDPLLRPERKLIAQLALQYRLPVSTGLSELAEAGAFMAYGPDRVDMARRAATVTDKILKGAKPAELPFEQAAKLDLVVNVRTAKTLGIAVPHSFLLRASRVID